MTISGSTPIYIQHNWFLLALVVFILFFFAVTMGTHKMLREQAATFKSQVVELKLKADQKWEERLQEVRAIQDDRDIPEVIQELKRERDNWIRDEHYDLTSAQGMAPDENWFVAKLKTTRPERLVRMAYRRWKADAYR
jgi:hypothetical protein